MMRWWYGLVVVGCVCLAAGGCTGDGKAKMAQVSGKVLLDDKPLDDGEIEFIGDPGTPSDILPVQNGAFSGKVKVGKKKVAIQAFKTEKAPPTATAGVTEERKNYLPAKWNTESQMTAEVTDGGVTPAEFKVESK
jgi:hypothetical protein